MKIASWNVNSLKVRLPHLQEWCALAKPDVVGLQELKQETSAFPNDAVSELGYQCAVSGQKTYNGVALLARDAISDVVTDIANLDDPQRRIIAGTINGIRVINLYVVNGQEVGSEKYAYKLNWFAAVHAWIAEQIKQYPKLVVMGDFNIAPDDRDVHDPESWRDKILCSVPERAALEKLQALGLHDSFRKHNDEAGHFSWWDYRQAGYRRNLGLRIDLVLLSDALLPHCTAAGIDRVPREWERPSDHAPAWVELAL